MRHLKKIAVMMLTILLCLTDFTAVLAEDEETTAESPSFTVSYEFVLDEGGENLPEEVLVRLPDPVTNLKRGDVVENSPIEDIAVDDLVYSFLGWSSDTVTVVNSDVTVTGTWTKKTVEETSATVKSEDDMPEEKTYYTARYVFAEASGRNGINNLPDEIMEMLPEEERVEVGTDYSPKEPSKKEVLGYEFHGYEPYKEENGDITYQGIWYNPDLGKARNLLKAGSLRASGSHTFGFLGQQGWGLAAPSIGYSGTNGFSIDGEESWCLDPHTAISEIGTAYDDSGSSGGRDAEIIAMGKMNGRTQGEIQAALWNEDGVGATVNGVYIDPNDSDFNSNGRYGYSVDLYGGAGLQTQAGSPNWWPLGGYVKVYKRAASTTFNYVANCPNNYSLAGAVYGIYNDPGCTSLEDTVTTGSSGESDETGALDPGTYYVKEISPSPGFYLDTNVYPVSVTAGSTSSITSTEQPMYDPVSAKVFKYDRRESKYVEHLDEAQFTLKYYDAQSNSPSNPKYTWVFACFYNDQGKVVCNFNPAYLISGPDPASLGLVDSHGEFFLPLGTYTIEETLAPKLFARDENIYVGHIRNVNQSPAESVDHYIDSQGTVHELTSGNDSWVEVENLDMSQKEELQTVSLVIQKVDQETRKAELPTDHITSTATLAGGVFHVYRTAEYNTDKENPELVDLAEEVDYGTIITDENGVAKLEYERINGQDTTDGLLPGKFRIVEEKAPDGFALKPTLAENTYILSAPVKERNTATFRYSMDISNKLTRIQLEKLDQNGDLISGEATATIQLIENETGRVVYEFVADGQAHVIKGLTTLMNYHLHELYVAPNYKLAIDKEVNVIDENDSELHGSADDEHPYTNYYHMVDHEVEIHTTATFSDEGKKEWDNQSNKHYVADGIAHIFDEVAYKNVYEGEQYKLVGELWDKTDDVSLNNVVEKEFTPAYDVGIETLEFDQELDDLDNHELVVFETLYRIVTHDDGTTEEIKVVEHRDLDDEGQTVYVDELYRRDFEIIKVNADDEDEILEGVTFNIKTYRIKRDGVVEDYDLGNYTTDENGKISIEKLKEDCKITVTEIAEKDPTWYRWEEAFIYDIGHDASIAEALSETILNHKIKIGTTAKFEESDEKNYVADGVAHIIDTVSYEWLYKGDEYKLVATLIDKDTEEKPLEEEVTTVEHEFVAEDLNGSTDVSIEFDFTGMDNHDFVVFEELYHIVENEEGEKEEIKVAEHKDIDDEDQTVHCDELYRAAMVLYKISENNRSIKLSGAYFNVKTSRTRRDGKVIEKDLGTYVTGGIHIQKDAAFKANIYSDEECTSLVKSVDSAYNANFGKQAISVLDLMDGIYYVKIDGEDTVSVHYVGKGMIYLPDQPEDTIVTYTEIIAPGGYYLDKSPFVQTVGHDYSLDRIENFRSNSMIIVPPNIPHTGYDG